VRVGWIDCSSDMEVEVMQGSRQCSARVALNSVSTAVSVMDPVVKR